MGGKRRENWIDCVKCIAIFIVMLNHSGLTIPGVNFWGGMFFVPVFFILSGYTYHTRDEKFGDFLIRKAKRLLLPYIYANLFLFLFFLIKDFIIGSRQPSDLIGIVLGILYGRNQLLANGNLTLFLPKLEGNVYLMTILNSPTWFLLALFLTIILFEILLRVSDRNGRKMCFIAVLMLFLAMLYHYLFPFLMPWSLDAIPIFFMFFLWGYFIRRKAFLYYLDKHIYIIFISIGLFIGSAWINGSANFSIGCYGKSAFVAMYNAIISSTLLMYVCFKLKKYIPAFLAEIGQHTLFLLCYHLFVYAILDSIFDRIQIYFLHSPWNQFIYPILQLSKIVITMAILTVFAAGKEKLAHAKKSSN